MNSGLAQCSNKNRSIASLSRTGNPTIAVVNASLTYNDLRPVTGGAAGKQGDVRTGIKRGCEGLSYREGFPVYRSTHLGLLADLCITGGELETAATMLQQANQRMVDCDGQRVGAIAPRM